MSPFVVLTCYICELTEQRAPSNLFEWPSRDGSRCNQLVQNKQNV